MVKINYERKTWYDKNDTPNASKRIPISATQLNRIEDAIGQSVGVINSMFEYWWKKSCVADVSIKPTASISSEEVYLWGTRYESTDFYYSDSISTGVDKETGEGYVELVDPSSINLYYQRLAEDSGGTYRNALRNKYFMIGTTSGRDVYYMKNDGQLYPVGSDSPANYGVSIRSSEIHMCVITYGNAGYVSADKSDAYSNGWNSEEEVYYEFSGNPFENSLESLNIEVGYYSGDGTLNRVIKTHKKPICVWLNSATQSSTIQNSTVVAELFSAGLHRDAVVITREGFVVGGNANDKATVYNYIYFY